MVSLGVAKAPDEPASMVPGDYHAQTSVNASVAAGARAAERLTDVLGLA